MSGFITISSVAARFHHFLDANYASVKFYAKIIENDVMWWWTHGCRWNLSLWSANRFLINTKLMARVRDYSRSKIFHLSADIFVQILFNDICSRSPRRRLDYTKDNVASPSSGSCRFHRSSWCHLEWTSPRWLKTIFRVPLETCNHSSPQSLPQWFAGMERME